MISYRNALSRSLVQIPEVSDQEIKGEGTHALPLITYLGVLGALAVSDPKSKSDYPFAALKSFMNATSASTASSGTAL